MIADCPHCFNRVYFPADGICPACHVSLHSTEGADYEKTKFTICESDSLPQHCYLCDAPTQRIAEWQHIVVHEQPTQFLGGFFSLHHMIYKVLHYVFSKAASFDERMSISLPQCVSCDIKPEADHIDFPKREATFVVHKEFAERVRSLRK